MKSYDYRQKDGTQSTLITKLLHVSDMPGFRGEGYSLRAWDGKNAKMWCGSNRLPMSLSRGTLLQRPQEAQRYREAREQGDFDVAAVIAGEGVGLVHDIPSAAEVIRNCVAEAERRLRSFAR